MSGKANVVFGSRFLGSPALIAFCITGIRSATNSHDAVRHGHRFEPDRHGGLLQNVPARNIQKIRIKKNRFGFEPEITAKVARLKVRIYEVAISYDGRTYAEGKKIGWRDGIHALWCIFKYNFLPNHE